LNHRQVLTALLRSFGIPAAQHADALVALDKLDKVGPDGVAREFLERGIEPQATRACRSFFGGGATGAAVSSDWLPRVLQQIPEDGSTAELRQLVELCQEAGGGGRVRVDPSLARGLSYYTGAIMEIAVPDLAGSLGGGGRYDHLIGMFLGRDVPACGFSLGLERIIVVMSERGMFPPTVAKGSIDAVITFMDDDSRAEELRLATELRATKIRVDVFPESSRKFDKS